jgi:hypothetical protein
MPSFQLISYLALPKASNVSTCTVINFNTKNNVTNMKTFLTINYIKYVKFYHFTIIYITIMIINLYIAGDHIIESEGIPALEKGVNYKFYEEYENERLKRVHETFVVKQTLDQARKDVETQLSLITPSQKTQLMRQKCIETQIQSSDEPLPLTLIPISQDDDLTTIHSMSLPDKNITSTKCDIPLKLNLPITYTINKHNVHMTESTPEPVLPKTINPITTESVLFATPRPTNDKFKPYILDPNFISPS